MNSIYKIFFSILSVVATLFISGCQDDLLYPDYRDIPEGSSLVNFELGYQDFTPALDTRSSGTALRDIKSLWLLVYRADDGVLLEKTEIKDFDSNGQADRTDWKDESGNPSSDSKTGHATFKFSYILPNGRYRMYAVANYDMSDAAIDAFTKEHPDLDITTNENALYHLPLSWDSNNLENNAEMFGWFVNGDQNTSRTLNAQLKAEVPQVVIKGSGTKVHCWLRRAASKVTVAFNTTGLNDDVHLYLKSVEIKDIPATCYLHSNNNLGAKNNNADDYYYDSKFAGNSEIIYFKGAQAEHTGKENHKLWPEITSNNYYFGLYSDANGAHNSLIDIDISRNEGESEEDFKKRYEAEYKKEYERRLAEFRNKEHGETVRALYFYENMQGTGVAGTQSDKKQVVDGANPTNVPTYPNGVYDKTHDENGNLRDDALVLGWKDAKQWGTYIEIKGYYEGATGRGDITYRFMLGKDTYLDYNSERNHHYKLTLVFKGKANDVDFHIDYEDEDKPGLFTPEEVYVPYLYNQPSKVIVRATPKVGYELESLKAVILKNEWRPTAREGGAAPTSADYLVQAWDYQTSATFKFTHTLRNRVYSYEVLKNWPKDDPSADYNCAFGFLSLYYMHEVVYEPSISGLTSDNHNAYVDDIMNALRDYYFKHKLNDPRFSGTVSIGSRTYIKFPEKGVAEYQEDDDINTANPNREHQSVYKVNRLESGDDNPIDYICEIPIYTRAKTIDSWMVYSGANSYSNFRRYALIKFTATYKETNGDGRYSESSYTNVYQTERLENPYGIYRRYNNLEPFHVNLKRRINLDDDASGDIFESVISEGPWTATIEQDPNGLVMLTGNGQVALGQGESITGRPNSQIDFTYQPRIEALENDSYGAIIRINYHNNTCVHKIIVRQGYAPTAIVTGGPKYSAFNVYDQDYLTASPLSVGSLFRRGKKLKETLPIAEYNNFQSKTGLNDDNVSDATYKVAKYGAPINSWASSNWAGLIGGGTNYPPSGDQNPLTGKDAFFDITSMTSWKNGEGNNTKDDYELPKSADMPKLGIADFQNSAIEVNNDVNFGLGVVYADGARNTLSTKDAFGFYDPENKIYSDKKGVRGALFYNLKTGRNVFLPIGSTGHARRISRSTSGSWLHFIGLSAPLGLSDNGRANYFRPQAYYINKNIGGAYWLEMRDKTDAVALEVNYSNFSIFANGLKEYGGNNFDALPIRPVQQSRSN